jgi:type IV pilus assembly protein PilB
MVEAVGCARCLHGYRGRCGIYEIMPVSLALRELIGRRAPAHVLRRCAQEEGMNTLAEDALRLLQLGVTTEAEARCFANRQ